MRLLKDIAATHVEQAIAYIREHGHSQGKHKIIFVGRVRGVYLAVVKEGRGYGIKEVLYVAYCFLTDEKPNKDWQFTKAQLKLLNEAMFVANGSKWVSHTGRNHLINLEFKVRDYENVLLLNISQTYKEGIAENELYEATRGVRVGDINRAESIKYAVAVADHVVREVYEIDSWQNAGTTKYKRCSDLNKEDSKRKEFVGKVDDSDIREELIGLNVGSWGQSPFYYEKIKGLVRKKMLMLDE